MPTFSDSQFQPMFQRFLVIEIPTFKKFLSYPFFLEISISFKIGFLIITKNWVRFARKWMKFHLISYKRIHFSQFDVTQAADSVRWFTLFFIKMAFFHIFFHKMTILVSNEHFSLEKLIFAA